MKIRSGFVSNSSSSSFIVPVMNSIKNFDYQVLKSYFNTYESSHGVKTYSITLPILSYNSDFGWDIRVYSDFTDKLNYLFLQIEELDDSIKIKHVLKDKLKQALQSICKKAYEISKNDKYKFKLKIDNNYYKNDLFGIDHQSAWYENFKAVSDYFNQNEPSSELIENYLIGDSYIQGGNDNEDMPEEFYESLSILKKYKEKL